MGLITCGCCFPALSQPPTPEQVVQQQLDTYNRRDIEAFMALFCEDVEIFNHADGKKIVAGAAACRQFYQELFEQSPRLHSQLLNRIVMGNKVIDHERITGRRGNDQPYELVMIYEVSGGKICRATVVRHS